MLVQSKKPRLMNLNKSTRTGAAAVEFALVASVFFLFIVASFEFARLNIMRHTADHAAYEAARLAMVPGGTAAEAIAEANKILRIVGTRGATVTITPSVLTPDADEISVSIDVPLDQNGWIAPKFSSGKIIHAQSRLKTERTGQ